MNNGLLTLSQLVGEWKLSMLAENRQTKTVKLYSEVLEGFISLVGNKPISQVTRMDVRQYLNHRREQHNPNTGKQLSGYTINKEFRILRVFFRWCRSDGYLQETPVDSMKAPKLPDDLPKALMPEQIKQLLEVARKGLYPERDELIVRFLLDTGVRLSELTNLRIDDIHLEQGMAIIRQGKGKKDRFVPLGAKLKLRVHRYLRDHRPAAPGERGFIVSRNGDKLSREGIISILARMDRQLPFHVSAHILRHTFATEYLRAGGDLESLRRIMGHSTLAVTQIYLHLVDEDLIKSHRSFSPGDRY